MATPRRCQIPPNELEIQPDNKRGASHGGLGEMTARTNDLLRGDRVGYRKAQQVDQHGSHIDEVRRQSKQGRNPRETSPALAGAITTGGQGGRHCLPADPPPPPWDPPLHLTRRASSHRKAATSEMRRSSDKYRKIDARTGKSSALRGAPQQQGRRDDPSRGNGSVSTPTCSPPVKVSPTRQTVPRKPRSTAQLYHNRRRSFTEVKDTCSTSDGDSVHSSSNSTTRCSCNGKGKTKHFVGGSKRPETVTDGGQNLSSVPSCWDAQAASPHDRQSIGGRNDRPRDQSRMRQSVTDCGEQVIVPKAETGAEDLGDGRRAGAVHRSTGSCKQQSGSCDKRRARSFRGHRGSKDDRSSPPGDDNVKNKNNKWRVEYGPPRNNVAPQSAGKIHEDGRAGNGLWNISHQACEHSLKRFDNNRGFVEAWGSEATPTPSPCTPGSGSADEIGHLGGTERVAAMVDKPIRGRAKTPSCRGDPRAEMRRSPSDDPENPEVRCNILRKGRQSSVGIVNPGGFVPDASITASERSRASNRKSNSFSRRVGRGNRRAMDADLPAPSTGRASLGDKTMDRRRCQEGGNLSVSGKQRRHSCRGIHREGSRTTSPRSSGEGESIAANRTSLSTRSSSDGEGSGSIISGRSSDIDDAQTYPGGKDPCDHGKPRQVVTGKWFAAEGELEGQARPIDPYRKDSSVISRGVVEDSGPWRERKRDAGKVKRDRTSEECGGRDGERAIRLLRPNPIMMSYGRGRDSDMVQCVIVRDRSGLNRLYPQYRFFFDGHEGQLVMLAHKCFKNRTSTYHVFNMQRGGFGKCLTKKNGNYLGKVRTNLKRTEATVFTNDQEVAELGAISFERHGIVKHLKEGSQPRRFSVLLPVLDFEGAPVANKVDPFDTDNNLLSSIKQRRYGSMFPLKTRDPTFSEGNYRLNFNGRVTVPSVKNFQLISPDDETHTVCQFGKAGEDRFHLDYRAPMNAFQAFCVSLAQFNF